MYTTLLMIVSALAATVVGEQTGEATYFIGDVAVGACADKVKALDPGTYGTAISTAIWDDTANCGKHLKVTGPNGATIDAMVVDRCMGCQASDVDLFEDAFAQLADPSKGRIPVKWDWA